MADSFEVLDTEKAGKFIGGRSPAAIRNLAYRKRIPFRKVGGRLMFIRSELVEWIKQSPGLSIQELKKNEDHRSYVGGYGA